MWGYRLLAWRIAPASRISRQTPSTIHAQGPSVAANSTSAKTPRIATTSGIASNSTRVESWLMQRVYKGQIQSAGRPTGDVDLEFGSVVGDDHDLVPAKLAQSTPPAAAFSVRRPLVKALLTLTFTTGLIDVSTFLGLGHVFAANQTGNIVLLAAGIAGSADLPVVAPLVSLGSFAA